MAPEQARLDSFVIRTCPTSSFISFLNDLLNVPVSLRKNHRLFNKLFFPLSADLTKYKLVKGNVTYPFHFTPIMKRIYSVAYSKLSPKTNDNGLDFVFDRDERIYNGFSFILSRKILCTV